MGLQGVDVTSSHDRPSFVLDVSMMFLHFIETKFHLDSSRSHAFMNNCEFRSILDHEFTIMVPRLQCEDVVVFTSSCLDVFFVSFPVLLADSFHERGWNGAHSSCNF